MILIQSQYDKVKIIFLNDSMRLNENYKIGIH